MPLTLGQNRNLRRLSPASRRCEPRTHLCLALLSAQVARITPIRTSVIVFMHRLCIIFCISPGNFVTFPFFYAKKILGGAFLCIFFVGGLRVRLIPPTLSLIYTGWMGDVPLPSGPRDPAAVRLRTPPGSRSRSHFLFLFLSLLTYVRAGRVSGQHSHRPPCLLCVSDYKGLIVGCPGVIRRI